MAGPTLYPDDELYISSCTS